MVVLTLGSTLSNEAMKYNTRPTSKVPISGSDNIHFLQDCGLEAEWVLLASENGRVAKTICSYNAKTGCGATLPAYE
jgi:hypothetical protein